MVGGGGKGEAVKIKEGLGLMSDFSHLGKTKSGQ